LQKEALNAGKLRAQQQLDLAASLSVTGNTLKVVNLTGHKLISGYPEGRRMWLNVKWYDAGNNLLREDGKYGDLQVTLDGQQRAGQDDPQPEQHEGVRGALRDDAGVGEPTAIALGYPGACR
jgi:hypothetical protein